MKAFEAYDVAEAAGLNVLGGENTAKILMFLLRFNKLNKLYSEHSDKSGLDFIKCLLDELDFKFEINEDDLKKIPKQGPFITVSNHPFGGIDGLLLIYFIAQYRNDFNLLGNYLFHRLDAVKEYLVPQGSTGSQSKYKNTAERLEFASKHLESGGGIGIFPANEVSTYYPEGKGVSDKEWEFYLLNFVKKAKVPVVPIYFQGNNSRLYHLLGRISPVLQTLKLPSEVTNKKNKTVRIRIGSAIPVKDQDEFKDISRYGRFLRAKTYSLGSSIEVKKFFNYTLRRALRVEDIITPTPQQMIEKEVDKLREEYLLFNNQNYEVYCAPSFEMPQILNEIGRLREITFREVGEGTNRKQDIDEFDLYYNQLFIWDKEKRKIVGAYRVGLGREILKQYGIRGFYIYSLFKIQNGFHATLAESLELGRSFIVKEYQRKPLPLFLLWKGILYFLVKHPEYRYLVGPVSISSRFSNFSKQVIMDFIKANYYNHELAEFIKPRNRMRVQSNVEDANILLENAKDINQLDKFIKDVETGNYRMPVLLKKYIQLNGKIIGFNIDPKFNNALDGLLILDLFEVPIDTITNLSKEINDDSLMDRFYNQEFNFANGITKF